MKPGLARAAWVGTALVLAGWLIAVVGFGPADGAQPMLPDLVRGGVRIFGFMLLMTGAVITVFATIWGPTLVMLFGVALNLAHQAGLIAHTTSGFVGAGLILLGALWASRRIRALPS